ncbi:MAG: Uma2 family endonuclease [Proteobacteria bacterium]|nr:Uma2 family endonuclease [Pseudomonadota bacterium]
MGDFLPNSPRLTLEVFHALRDERPKEEKWELINGVPMMMPPPSLVHQRIAKNIGAMLDERLAAVRPEWISDHEIGVLLPNDDKFNPEPDVTVIDTAIELGQIYAERFYFVAEVLSDNNRPEQRAGSDKPIVLAAKLGYYQAHEHCRGVLIVRQDVVEADLHVRGDDGWHRQELRDAAARIVVPDIGDIGRLGDLYRHTPLFPKSG